ncbi:MAG: hypothetical protein OXC66_03680 [Roseovarius sp.]|nr:hypothetical protein [Roseovarius sp.]
MAEHGFNWPEEQDQAEKLIALLDDESNGLPDLVCSTARMHIGHIDAFSAKIGVFDKQVKMTKKSESMAKFGADLQKLNSKLNLFQN